MLKKGLCCCFCCSKKKEDEESLYTDPEHDVEDETIEDVAVGGDIENGILHHSDEALLEDEDRADEEHKQIPEIIITEGHFVPEKKSKKKQLTGMFKKMKLRKGESQVQSVFRTDQHDKF